MAGSIGKIMAVATFAASAGLAHAGALDRLDLRLNGHASVVGAYVDQSNMDGLDEGVLAVDTGLFGSASLPLDGGGEIGGRIALDLDYATNFDSFLNDAGASDILEELWAYWEGRFGRLQFGLVDGAADIMGFGPPSVTKSIRVDGPEVFLLGYPCRVSCGSDPQEPGSLFSPNGMQLRSDIHGSDDYLKLIYFTPEFHGLRFAVSYAPDGTRDLGQLFGDDEINEQGNVWDVGLNYIREIGEVDFGFSLGYVTGENVNNQFGYGNLQEWGGAVKLAYREWTFGTAYRRTNAAGGGPVVQGIFTNVYDDTYTDIWSAGVAYERGPWSFGANYIHADEDLPFGPPVNQEGSGVQFAAGYTFDPNIRMTGGYQHFEFDGPFDSCPTDGGGPSCDTLDGDVGYLETTFSF
jgi:predicted porin